MTPILNPPQSGILGMHNIVERPVGIEGRIELRPIMYVALTYAHRIAVFDVDGFMLRRSPFVLRVGHGPSSMALGPRLGK